MALNEALKILIQFESTAERVPGLRSLSCVSVNVAALVLNGWSFLALMKCLVFLCFFLIMCSHAPAVSQSSWSWSSTEFELRRQMEEKYVLLICKLLLFLFLLILNF